MSDSRLAAGATAVRRLLALVLVSALAGVLVAGLVLPLAGLTGVAARNVATGIEDLPAELDEVPIAQRTTVLDSRGTPIAYFFDENRVDVALEDVSPVMKRAILSIEDARFYEHGALDIQGTVRALVNNALGEPIQGGSSITQQLVKQILVAEADTRAEYEAAIEQTVGRKLEELQYAMAYEQDHTKDEILESYLNIAYFGDQAYGIASAARHYFSVEPGELNLRQSAMLAGLVQNPSSYEPTDNPGLARERRGVVLRRMVELDATTQEAARRANTAPLGLDLTETTNGCVTTVAPFFCDYVSSYLLDNEALGPTRSARESRLFTGGLTIRTTLDQRMQRAADRAVQDRVDPTDQAIGGMAMVEPRTGEVRALAQSRPMGDDTAQGETYLNYTVPKDLGGAAGFQAGSTFKSFVLASALQQGLPLDTTIYSPQYYTVPSGAVQDCDGNDVADWSLSNSTGTGNFDMYSGTQQSVNTYFAQLEERTNLCPPVSLVREMGIEVPENDEVAPFTLGVTDVSPLSMAAAYATFPGRGVYCEPTPVQSIEDRDGNPIELPEGCERLFRPAVGDAVNDVLRGVQEESDGFGFLNDLDLEQISAGKTGTTSDNKSVWFMGYTPNLVTSSMIAGANDAGSPLTLEGQSLGGVPLSFDAIGGSSLAGPMWKQAMATTQRWLPDRDFHALDTSKIGGAAIEVPSLAGLTVEEASAQLRDAGLVPVVSSTVDSSYAAGAVAYTSPSGGSEAVSGDQVFLFVSDGSPYVPPTTATTTTPAPTTTTPAPTTTTPPPTTTQPPSATIEPPPETTTEQPPDEG